MFEGVTVTSLEGLPLLSVEERKEEDQSFRKALKSSEIGDQKLLEVLM